jgi:hypothetical protein
LFLVPSLHSCPPLLLRQFLSDLLLFLLSSFFISSHRLFLFLFLLLAQPESFLFWFHFAAKGRDVGQRWTPDTG